MSATLQPAVREVLERSRFDGGVLVLPPGQLDRKLYVAVNGALEALGGKWNKKVKGHVFETDAAAQLSAMLGSGIVPPKNPDAFFPTPLSVVEQMLDIADEAYSGRCESEHMLEPSAGLGAIAWRASERFPAHVLHCVELNEARARRLSDAGLRYVWNCDFLDFGESDTGLEGGYAFILMNPPFAIEGDAAAWMTHIEHAVTLLAPHGVLVSVVPVSCQFRNDRKHTVFRDAYVGRSEYIALPEGTFKESGTGVNCGILRVSAGAQ